MEKIKMDLQTYFQGLDEKDRNVMMQLHHLIIKYFDEKDIVFFGGNFWSGSRQLIVGYGAYESIKKDVEWFYIGMAVQKNYYSIYINAANEDGYLIKQYNKDQLGKVKMGSSSISFTKIENVRMDVLEDIIKRAAQMRIKK